MADWYIDPDETKIFIVDWAPLENGTGDSNFLDRTSSPVESISSQTTTSLDSPGLTVSNSSINATSTAVTVTLTAANCTPGESYRLRNRVTTSTSQVIDETIIVRVRTK